MKDTRTQKSIVNISFNLLNQIITIVLSFVSRKIFINVLSIEYLGINGLFADILNLLSMADLGFSIAMVYSFYKPLAENDKNKAAGLITFYRRIYNTIAAAVSVLGLSLLPFLRLIVNTENDVPDLELYYILSLAGVVVSYLFAYRMSIITADQKDYIITRINIAVSLSKTLLQIISLLLFKNYVIYLAIGIAMTLANNIIASLKANRIYPFIKEKTALEKSDRQDIWNNIKSVFIYKASSVLLNATNNIFISVLVGTAAVGLYSNYTSVQAHVTGIVSAVFVAMTASIGNVIVKEKEEKRYEIFRCGQVASFMICGVVVPCFTGLINDLIVVWLGNGYTFSADIVYSISLGLYLGCALQPLWSYREATGLYQKTKWMMALCALVNLALSFILGKAAGLAGILLASSLARILTYVWYEPRLLFKNYFNLPCGKYFKDILLNLALTVSLCLTMTVISGFFPAVTWLSLILKGAAFFLLSASVTLAFYRRTPAFKLLVNRFRGIAENIIKKNK